MKNVPKKGTLVKPNSLFKTDFPKARVSLGTVVGFPRFGRGVMVKWAGRRTVQAIHVDYLSTVK